jgi:hypothetical protein
MYISKKVLFCCFLLLFFSSSCVQIQQAIQLAKCDFRLKDVSNLDLAGVDLQKIESWSDIGFLDVAKLTASFAQGTLPVKFTLNVELRNPNSEKAALNRLDWILMIDQTQMAEGTTNQRVEVLPNGGTAVMPISISSDMKKILSGESLQSLANIVLNMADSGGKPTKLTLKAKPYINIGNTTIAYPGYINIKTEFTSE